MGNEGHRQALLGGRGRQPQHSALSPPQYFVFDFHVSPDVMFDKIIKISVSGGLLKLVGRTTLTNAGPQHGPVMCCS
jgi:hypothetical protein